MQSEQPWQFRPRLIALAMVIGPLFSIGERVIFAMALDRAFDLGEQDVIIFRSVIAAIPFAVLACRRNFNSLPWLATILLTASLQWWWISKGIAYQRAPDGSGVDLFGGFVLIFSPIPITALALGIDYLIEWVRSDPLTK